MDIFGLLKLIGGLALFLYGMRTMGEGLSQLSGGKLEYILEKLTSTRWKGFLLGTAVTAIIQSSSATTVMVVGFVNSGIMQLSEIVGIIMGANVGTTVTSWLLSLVGIEGSSLWVKLLKPSSFSPVLAAIGIVLLMTAGEKSSKREIGNILVGFAILMTGMDAMSSAVSPLAEHEEFRSLFTMFSNPILGMLAGAVLTAVIQSSSASIGILQALCTAGAVSYGAAIPIILGQNIGTCATALISSIGAGKNGRRASMIHLYFNLIGTILFMVVFYTLNVGFRFSFLEMAADPVGIAIIHTLFNIGCAVVLFPFGNQLMRLAVLSIPEKEGEKKTPAKYALPRELSALDERFLEKPGFALQLAHNAVCRMAQEAEEMLLLSGELLSGWNREKSDRILRKEDLVDIYENRLGSYLVRISARNLSAEDGRNVSRLLHCIIDLERIADHAVNIRDSAEEMREKGLIFSEEAKQELGELRQAVEDIMEMTLASLLKTDAWEALPPDSGNAARQEARQTAVEHLRTDLRSRHIERLCRGTCTIELGIIFEDLLTDYERICEHCQLTSEYCREKN
jgi:phosphate:Na+ symporter